MSVTIETHVPERRRKAVTTVCCGCSCCCCCCLHTLGSLVGAAIAPGIGKGSPVAMVYYFDEDTGRQIPLDHKPGLSAVVMFWWVLCFLIFLCFTYGILTNSAKGETLLITGIIVLMVFPILQIASAVITVVVFAVWNRPDRAYQIWQLGRITLGVVLGTLLGIGVMALIGVGFGALK